MAAMSLAAARVVDPILTTVARGYRHAGHIFTALFPIVSVGQRAGKIIEFGAEDFLKRNLGRAPGADRPRLNVGYEGKDYAVSQRALDGVVTRELMQEAAAVPGIDLGRRAVSTVLANTGLQLEIAAASLSTKTDNYAASNHSALSGTSQWDHKSSKPQQAVEDAKEAVAAGIGVEPNLLVLGEPVYRKLKSHPDIIERIKYTEGLGSSNAATVTPEKLAAYFDVPRVEVGRARMGKPGSFVPVWDKYAILAYVGQSSLDAAEANMGEPSFGYTYRLDGYPMVEEAWFDKRSDSWVYPVTCEETSMIAGQAAGYLFSSVVS